MSLVIVGIPCFILASLEFGFRAHHYKLNCVLLPVAIQQYRKASVNLKNLSKYLKHHKNEENILKITDVSASDCIGFNFLFFKKGRYVCYIYSRWKDMPASIVTFKGHPFNTMEF